jgi:hypothetical protein
MFSLFFSSQRSLLRLENLKIVILNGGEAGMRDPTAASVSM